MSECRWVGVFVCVRGVWCVYMCRVGCSDCAGSGVQTVHGLVPLTEC